MPDEGENGLKHIFHEDLSELIRDGSNCSIAVLQTDALEIEWRVVNFEERSTDRLGQEVYENEVIVVFAAAADGGYYFDVRDLNVVYVRDLAGLRDPEEMPIKESDLSFAVTALLL